MIQKYPLAWPQGWKRTGGGYRKHAAFNRVENSGGLKRTLKLSIGDAVKRVFYELERLGVKHVQEDVVISTNLRVNMSGIPRGDQGEPSDPGAAVYWELNGVRQTMAIDQYYRVADNLAAIAASLEAMRAIERHGGAEILQRAFTGFAALPQNIEARPWREVLGYGPDQLPELANVEKRYIERVREAHHDTAGGSETRMRDLNVARDQARKELAP
jgi:hypothetical protein